MTEPGAQAIRVVDGIARQVELPAPPRRIVSLVPSTTETLFALGVGDRLVGRTRYCVHPARELADVPEVGGTKSPRLAELAALRPDLVLANEEENKPALWPRLELLAPLYVAYPRTVDEALHDLRTTARLVGAEARGDELVATCQAARAELARVRRPFTYAYLIWKDPWMAVGPDTFVASMLAEVGGRCALNTDERYPRLELDALVAADPDVVYLSSEPYAFTAEHAAELGRLAERARLVDGELCSWHGARMVRALPYLAELLPEA